VISGARDNTVRVWDAETGAERLVLSADPNAIVGFALSPDGRTLALATQDQAIRLYDAAGFGSPPVAAQP